MSWKLAFGGITKFFFSKLDIWRQGLPKPSKEWPCQAASDWHCEELSPLKQPMMLQTVFRATLFGTVLFESNHESLLFVSSPWHLAMGCRRTIGRSDLAKPHQTDTEPSFEERSAFQPPMILKTVFKSTMVGFFWETFHQTLRLVPSPKDIPSLTIGDRFAETHGKEWLANYFEAAVPSIVQR